MKLTAQDYRNAIEVDNGWIKVFADYPSFDAYCQAKIAELEKPEPPMYRCIQLPPRNGACFKLGKLYGIGWCCGSFNLSDLPFHFELAVPESEKITWDEAINLLENVTRTEYSPPDVYKVDLVRIIDRIEKDHLS